MKKILIFSAALLCISLSAGAQSKKDGWKEKIMSEKIAFLTSELSLTPDEAQVFWPVYNASWEKRDNVHRKAMEAYKNLSRAIDAGKPEKEISRLLDEYISALDTKEGMEAGFCEEYKQVLPETKVAKLYIAEEKFRRNQIHRLCQPQDKQSGK